MGDVSKKCKIKYCSGAVDPKARKQHCTTHMNAYSAKRAEWCRIQATLPECAGKGCKSKIPPCRQGQKFCSACDQKLEEAKWEERWAVKELAAQLDATDKRLVEYDQLDSFEAFHAWLRPSVESGEL